MGPVRPHRSMDTNLHLSSEMIAQLRALHPGSASMASLIIAAKVWMLALAPRVKAFFGGGVMGVG